MPGKLHHERIHRGQDLLDRLAATRIVICGVGAIGSNLAENLARQGANTLCAIDHDRVEEHNVSTQAYSESDIGVWKVEALRSRIFRAAGVEIDAVRKELTPGNAGKLLKDAGLIIDAFDNSGSRRLVQDAARAAKLPCLHVGLAADYGEVIWDEIYRVPADAADPACDQPLARNLILLAVALASETIVRFLATGERLSRSATLADFAVRPIDG